MESQEKNGKNGIKMENVLILFFF